MGRKGKKKLAKKSSKTPQRVPGPQERDSLPLDGGQSSNEAVPFDVLSGIVSLEARIAELKLSRDLGFSDKHIDLLPLYMAEVKALKARIRDEVAKKDKDGADDSSGVASQFDLTICSAEENDYYDSLRGYLDTWKTLYKEGTKEGRKSLIEVLRSDGGDGDGNGDEDLRAGVFEMLIDAGIKISSLMAEYLALFIGLLEDSEILGRFRVIKNTLMMEHLDKDKESPVIDRFVQVLDSAIGKIRALHEDVKGKPIKVDDDHGDDKVLFGTRESELLGSIFFKVLYLEVALCFTSFSEKLENKDVKSLKVFLAELFEEKLRELSSDMNEFKKRCETSDDELSSKRNELKEALDSEIKEIWKGLDLK